MVNIYTLAITDGVLNFMSLSDFFLIGSQKGLRPSIFHFNVSEIILIIYPFNTKTAAFIEV